MKKTMNPILINSASLKAIKKTLINSWSKIRKAGIKGKTPQSCRATWTTTRSTNRERELQAIFKKCSAKIGSEY
jgi:hypothetical protein